MLCCVTLLLLPCTQPYSPVSRPPAKCPSNPAKLAADPKSDCCKEHSSVQAPLGQGSTSKEDRWALQQLAVDGEEVVGRVHLPQYLLLARTLLVTPLGMASSPTGLSHSGMKI